MRSVVAVNKVNNRFTKASRNAIFTLNFFERNGMIMTVKPQKDYPRHCPGGRAEEARPEEYIGFRRKLTGKRKVI